MFACASRTDRPRRCAIARGRGCASGSACSSRKAGSCPTETMRASLDEYWKKRDFGATSEPKGRGSSAKGGAIGHARAAKRLSFVIQKHAARRLHYDFRLELDGTLKSWAVPKGPSLDPGDKRLAMHVEDHPLEYGDFEGTIPKGEYGGGTGAAWGPGARGPPPGRR